MQTWGPELGSPESTQMLEESDGCLHIQSSEGKHRGSQSKQAAQTDYISELQWARRTVIREDSQRRPQPLHVGPHTYRPSYTQPCTPNTHTRKRKAIGSQLFTLTGAWAIPPRREWRRILWTAPLPSSDSDWSHSHDWLTIKQIRIKSVVVLLLKINTIKSSGPLNIKDRNNLLVQPLSQEIAGNKFGSLPLKGEDKIKVYSYFTHTSV